MKQKRVEKVVNRNLKLVMVFCALVITSFAVVFAVRLSENANPLVKINAPIDGGRPSDIDKDQYNELIKDKKSFIIMVDNNGCSTTARMREMLQNFPENRRFSYFRIMWSDAIETNLHDDIKYYPSIAIVKEGKVKYYLRADDDEDTKYYNDQSALESWIEERIDFSR